MSDINQIDINAKSIQSAAKMLLSASRTRAWIEAIPSDLSPLSTNAAYVIQESTFLMSGRVPAGWKIGCTSLKMQQLLGSDQPIAGRLFADTVYQSPAMVSNHRVDMMLVEAEFAFLLDKDLPPSNKLYDIATVIPAVKSILPAVEIVHERYIDWKNSSLLEKIADNSGHGSLVLGTPCSVERAGNLADKEASISIDGKIVATGKGSFVLDDPYNALVWLANMLSKRGIGLKAGDVVTSGSCTGISEVPLGAPVLADFGLLGVIEFGFSSEK